MSLVDQLVQIYQTEENWHEKKLSEADSAIYFESLLKKGRILYSCDTDNYLQGYVESWRISFHNFGRIICGEPFSAVGEDVETGNVCYLANIFIRKPFRKAQAILVLKHLFFRQNFMCTHFVGEARRKKCAPVKVFTRQEFYKKYISEER